jgi:hypothetical protein
VRFLVVALLHELEEDVGLLGTTVHVPELVNAKDVEAGEAIDELSRGAIGEGGVHLVEEVLGPDEEATVAVLEGLEEDSRGEARFPDAGLADEDDVFGLADEVELGESADLPAVVDRP